MCATVQVCGGSADSTVDIRIVTTIHHSLVLKYRWTTELELAT